MGRHQALPTDRGLLGRTVWCTGVYCTPGTGQKKPRGVLIIPVSISSICSLWQPNRQLHLIPAWLCDHVSTSSDNTQDHYGSDKLSTPWQQWAVETVIFCQQSHYKVGVIPEWSAPAWGDGQCWLMRHEDSRFANTQPVTFDRRCNNDPSPVSSSPRSTVITWLFNYSDWL